MSRKAVREAVDLWEQFSTLFRYAVHLIKSKIGYDGIKKRAHTREQKIVMNRVVPYHSSNLLVSTRTIFAAVSIKHGLSSRNLVDLDAHRDRTLLGLQHNQVVVVGDIINSRFEEASAGDDAQSNECSHDVDFAVCKARLRMNCQYMTDAEKVLRKGCCLLFANARTAALAKCKEGLLQLVVGHAIDKPSFRDELIRVREEFSVPVVDHRGHADRSASWDDEFGLAIFALVEQFFFTGDSCRPVGDTGHHA